MTITTEEAERLAQRLANDAEAPQTARYQPYTDSAMRNAAVTLRSLAAERDALRAENARLQDDVACLRLGRNDARLLAADALNVAERRIARQRRALAKLYRKRYDRKAENARLLEGLCMISNGSACKTLGDPPSCYRASIARAVLAAAKDQTND
jgi:cell division protein FtsB